MTAKQWEGSQEQAEFIKREHDAVLDVLIAAGMWTGNPPYRGVNAAGQVKMLLDEIQTLRTDNTELRFIVAGYRDGIHTASGQRNAERHRADVAEQERDRLMDQLAAVPVAAIRGVIGEDPLGDDLDAVAAWLGIVIEP